MTVAVGMRLEGWKVRRLMGEGRDVARNAVKNDTHGVGSAMREECQRLYFNNARMFSGVAVISVTAHRPAPISFRLAPRKWTLSSMIRKRS